MKKKSLFLSHFSDTFNFLWSFDIVFLFFKRKKNLPIWKLRTFYRSTIPSLPVRFYLCRAFHSLSLRYVDTLEYNHWAILPRRQVGCHTLLKWLYRFSIARHLFFPNDCPLHSSDGESHVKHLFGVRWICPWLMLSIEMIRDWLRAPIDALRNVL